MNSHINNFNDELFYVIFIYTIFQKVSLISIDLYLFESQS